MIQVAIVGGGPGGLMVAEQLATDPRFKVTVYDGMPSPGRKFLQAGRGGLNITHDMPFEQFVAGYGQQAARIRPWLSMFGPDHVREWVHSFGLTTFVGSSGRVYPQDMKAAPLLRKWLQRLRQQGVQLLMRHQWQGWDNLSSSKQLLKFQTPDGEQAIAADRVILALGGASWPHLGSNGAWIDYFNDDEIAPFLPANCGFEQAWSPIFQQQFAGQPLKNVRLTVVDAQQQAWSQLGECLITQAGIEGSLIYSLSRMIRDTLMQQGRVQAHLDLLPALTEAQLLQRLSKPRGKLSISNFLKRTGIDGVRLGLLREQLTSVQLNQAVADPAELTGLLKHYQLHLTQPRPIAEAISSAGGVRFSQVDGVGQLITRPGCYCAGEMLDWEAPTGGFLLTAVLSQSVAVAQQIKSTVP
ncbi:BaiN/RdsA family NAD(P)/FAD-dependent oxidoreductase [Thiomicrospira cyclica]|uniref:Uncharacterized flavoprotein, PP_4765 family n=1 Tax=Thiomicrospira cyclica (strain DSM 14477 / JCM 11371 / ALM1) TaxID=717773 RepID=F6DA82_THICA|nr:TIGR03862 family flavoprotein [Thiomicrospira cyclica]AEG32213.1 uncharacterized flavoprotein, PP_4765 family [Thiomicrospira cyclica ALM1]